jgi:hypothetical protein
MTPQEREVMQMALNALNGKWNMDKTSRDRQAIEALREALAPTEPKPVASLWQHDETGRTRIITPDMFMDLDAKWFKVSDLYTVPPKQKWVGLTEKEITDGNVKSWVDKQAWESAVWWAEAKLKDKNT